MGSNAKTGSAAKIKMESFDDLFGGNAVQGNGTEQIINAPLAILVFRHSRRVWRF